MHPENVWNEYNINICALLAAQIFSFLHLNFIAHWLSTKVEKLIFRLRQPYCLNWHIWPTTANPINFFLYAECRRPKNKHEYFRIQCSIK